MNEGLSTESKTSSNLGKKIQIGVTFEKVSAGNRNARPPQFLRFEYLATLVSKQFAALFDRTSLVT